MKEVYLNIGEFKLDSDDDEGSVDLWAKLDDKGAKLYFYYIDEDEKEKTQDVAMLSSEVIKILYSLVYVSNMEQNNKSQIFINQPYNSN